ncbi:MAG: 3-oxoacyl-ACP reductase [Pseudomonadales bacterium]|nr:3-oxoacyl-ACP reductase [Pseudomonadales bacterium]
MDLQLAGKTALVSGAHRGTGNVIATTLAEEGATVVLHAFTPQEADAAMASIADETLSVIPVVGDLLTDEGTQQIMDQIARHSLHIDILVNNYGTALAGKWDSLSTTQWLEATNVNVLSAVRLIQHCVPHMKENHWGRIINLSTMGDHQPNSIMPHYYAAKAALSNASVSLAKELSATGITVNTVSPGLIHTQEMERAYQLRAQKKGWPRDWESLEQHIVEHDFPNPCGRLAKRQEVADLVVFLASPRAGFINGQNIRVDGGAVRYV